VSTGGFSSHNASLAHFDSSLVEWIAVVAMVLAGGRFALYYRALRGRPGPLLRSAEFRTYVALVLVAVLVVLVVADTETSVSRHLRDSFFTITSITSTTGYVTADFGFWSQASQMVILLLLPIGAMAGSTAGGVKVTTFALLGFVIWAEVRGDPDVNAFGRRIPNTAQRQAVALVLLAVGAVITATFALVLLADVTIGPALFEALSAFGTVGLSTGITDELGTPAQLVLVVLMFLGRVGPINLFAALVLRERGRLYRLPQERPIIG
jgi:Trk-type K+ transport system membrane component